MPFWITTLLLIGIVAALLLFLTAVGIWVIPIVLVALIVVGVVRAIQARQSPGEERRS